MIKRKLVFVDIETSGLKATEHAIIQIGAVACTLPDLEITDHFTIRIKFRIDKADPIALLKNTYARQVGIPEGIATALMARYEALEWAEKQDSSVVRGLLSEEEAGLFFQNHHLWQEDACTPATGERMLSAFLKKHATIGKVGKRSGKHYNVAQLAGHNITAFDMPFLQEWYRRQDAFFPAEYFPLDTLQWALQTRTFLGVDYPDLSLETLCRYHGLAEKQTHDALDDVYLNVALARALHHRIYLTNDVSAAYVSEDTITQGLPDEMKKLLY